MFKRIVVPLDGSRFSERAVPRALDFASRWGAALDLAVVAILDLPGLTAISREEARGDSLDAGRKHAEEYLDSIEARIREAGFEGEVGRHALPAGNIVPALVNHISGSGADLAVMTTHGRGPLRRAWLGSTADGLVRRSPVPVLLVRPDEQPEDDAEDGPPSAFERPAPFMRILFPMDGSLQAEQMLELAAPLLGDGCSAILFRAVPPFIPGGSPYLPHLVRDLQGQSAVKQAAQDYLDGLIASTPCANTTTSVVTAGQPAVATLRVAEAEGVDLIAISTVGRGGVSRLLIGSVADKVVRGSRVPVLVHRAP